MTKFVVCVMRTYTATEYANIEIDADDEEEAKADALIHAEYYPHLFISEYEPPIDFEAIDIEKKEE